MHLNLNDKHDIINENTTPVQRHMIFLQCFYELKHMNPANNCVQETRHNPNRIDRWLVLDGSWAYNTLHD